MNLTVVTPTKTLVMEKIAKLVAEAPNGSFGILPRHIDFVSQLTAGILIYHSTDGTEHFIGLNQGTLIKCGDSILISTPDGMAGDDLVSLRRQIEKFFVQLDEQERIARSALARLEAGIVRRLIDLEKSA